jgi:3',5'-cyclic AMP phosphodiesterase CpdA
MQRIAHLSDVHILDARAGARAAGYRVATRLVSMGRIVDPRVRARRLAGGLAAARAAGADHVVISGDLTEVGEQVEFEHFAEVLHDAGLAEGSVTLVPGNHDAYTSKDGWRRAVAGPLARFASASAAEPGKVVDRGSVAFLPIDTSCFSSIAWSGGVFTRQVAELVDRRLADPALRDRAVVLVVHHPPFHPHALPFVRWIDGLRGAAEVLQLLARHPRLQLLHGHLHRVFDRILATSTALGSGLRTARFLEGGPRPPQLFGASATCDAPDDLPAVRLYDVRDGSLHPVRGPAARARAA